MRPHWLDEPAEVRLMRFIGGPFDGVHSHVPVWPSYLAVNEDSIIVEYKPELDNGELVYKIQPIPQPDQSTTSAEPNG